MSRPLPARPPHLPGDPVPGDWAPAPDFAWGCALFDGQYYWEAHEVWEAEWRPLVRGSPESDLLQGLICAAAFAVKLHQARAGQPALIDAAGRLLDRAKALLARAGAVDRGVDLPDLVARLDAHAAGAPPPTLPWRDQNWK